MDKRNKKGCSKCLCWSLCLGVVGAIVIIAILAASGVFNKEAQPVSSEVESRGFTGNVQPEEAPVKAAGGLFGLGTDKKPGTTPLTPGPPVTTMSSIPQSTETSMISVPRAVESRLLIDNAQFYPELAHTNSTEFKELASILEREIMNALFADDVQKYGAANIEVKVMEFMPGSIIVKYRVAWTFKEGIHKPVDPIDKDSLKKKMDKTLANNSGYLHKYHVPYDTVISERIIDLCQIENNDCEHECSFDYNKADFMCHCPDGMELTIDEKTCQFIIDVPKAEPEPTAEPKAEPEPTSEPEPSAEPKPEPEPTSEPEPEPKSEPEPEPTSEPEPEPKSEPEPTPEPKSEPEPMSEPEHASKIAHLEHEPTEEPKSEPEPTAEPKSEPEPTPEPKSEPEPTPEPKSEPEPTSEPKSEPEPTPEPKSEPEPTPEPKSEPEPTPEPKSEPEPTPEPKSEPEPTAEPKSEPEPTAEPKSEPEPTAEPKSEPEPTAEPKSEPEPTAEPKSEPEPTPEPKSEPEASTEHEPEHRDDLLVIPMTKHEQETTQEPNSELSSTEHSLKVTKEEPEATPEPAAEPTAEPSPEPSPEPESKSEEEHSAEDHHYDIIEPDFIVTPTPDPDDVADSTTKEELHVESRGHSSGDDHSTNAPTETSSTTASPMPEHESTTEEEKKVEAVGIVKHIYDVAETTMSSMETSSSTTESIIEMKKEYEEAHLNVIPLQKPTTDSTVMETDSPIHKVVIQEVSGTEKSVDVTENSREHWIPVNVNESHNNLFASNAFNEISETKNETETTTSVHEFIPVVINNKPETIESKNFEFENISVPNEQNVTVASETTTEVNKTEHNTEHFNVVESMSPFLPEIENERDHLTVQPHLEHIDADHHDLRKEPRLDDDQMNMTNPKDDNMIPAVTIRNNSTDSVREALTTPNPFINRVEPIKIIDQSNNQNTYEVTTMTEEDMATTVIPEMPSEKPLEINSSENKFTDLSSSTEMLIAMETTTNNLHSGVSSATSEEVTASSSEQEQPTTVHSAQIDSHTEMPKEEKIPVTIQPEMAKEESEEKDGTTVHAEIVHTVTETIQGVHEEANGKSAEKMAEASTEPAKEASPVDASLESIETTSTTTTTTSKPYEVSESVAENDFPDIATKYPDLTVEKDPEDPILLVVPLPNKKKHLSKLEQKRVASDDNFGKLDNANILNDITSEDEAVLDKFNNLNNFDNDIGSRNDAESVETNPEKYNAEFVDKTTQKTFLDKTKKKSYFDKKYSKTDAIAEKEDIADVKPEEMPEAREVIDGSLLGLGFSKCAAGQFQCVNGTSVKDGSYCIPKSDRCDSIEDCTDSSDEMDCVDKKCPDNFQCSSGQCLKRHFVCDGIINCNDGSDEQECSTWQCRFDEFQCSPGGRCIPLAWKCDGLSQCPEMTDEQQCPKESCANDEFHCVDQNTCIPASWRCNGHTDCLGGEDEKLCDCPVDQFKCVTGGGCISSKERCDGIENCADRSDEWDCVQLGTRKDALESASNISYVEIQSSEGKWQQICAEQWNNTYSDLVCQQLGYSGAIMTENITPKVGTPFLKLKSTQQRGSPLLTMFESTESCLEAVAVSCQDFTCGSQSTVDTQTARIIGGSSAAESQWPSITLLYNKKRNAQCTGSLVAPKWVLASYSCIMPTAADGDAKAWSLYAGGAKYFTSSDNSTTQIRGIKSIVKQPQTKYDQFLYSYDAVLMELSSPLILSRNVSVVCLPDAQIEQRQLCVTAGWGVSKPGEANIQQYLNYIPVPVTDKDECNSSKHYNGRIGEDKICAGYTESEKSVCYNDEGAPLMCFNEASSIWELQGVLSYHGSCGKSRHPPIYTSLNTVMKQWISKTVGEKAILNKRSASNTK